MKILLTKGYAALVDPELYEDLSKYKWHASINGERKVYAVRGESGKRFYMHRQIVSCPNGYSVDHINGNCLDNRLINLRICRHIDNIRNRGIQKNNSSGFKGVSLHKQTHRWTARIQAGNSYLHLGCFQSKEEAALAYDHAAIKYYGEFAKLNFPKENT